MFIKTEQLQEVANKILLALDTESTTGDKLELKVVNSQLQLNVSNREYYQKERIVMQEVSNQNQPFRTKAIISPKNYICGHSTNSLTPLSKDIPLLYFLGLINSLAFNYYCDYFSYTNHITVSGIKQVPIPKPSLNQMQLIASLVDKVIANKQKTNDTCILEREIDQQIYALYNLTPEEIAIIEQN